MAKTPLEYAGLVDTFDIPIEETTTFEKWQKALGEKLGIRYSPFLAEETWEAMPITYEALPELGIQYRRIEQWWGWQSTWRSLDPSITGVPAGRFISQAKVSELIRGLR